MGMKALLITVILAGLFLFASIQLGVQLGEQNNASISILENPSINKSYVNIESELEDTTDSAESQRQSFFKDIPIVGEITLIVQSIIGIVRVFLTSIVNFFNVFFTLLEETLGIPSLVLKTLTGIILIVVVLLAWRIIKTGR